jgi:chromate transport protein ChrA
VTPNALLGVAVVVFGVAGLAVGIARVAPGSTLTDLVIAMCAGLAGAIAFALVLRIGRRRNADWARWLIVPGLIAAFYLDRLPERWQLAILLLAAGYFAGFLGTILVRAVRLSRR